jgi:hypothetical protein
MSQNIAPAKLFVDLSLLVALSAARSDSDTGTPGEDGHNEARHITGP